MKALKEFVHMIVIPVAIALFCSKVLIVNANIPSGSMEDTIHPGDRVIGSRLAYLSQGPERGDIIIFRYPDDESQVFIKRVIGLPQEEVLIVDGQVYIDGAQKPLKELYLKEIPQGSFGPYEVPEDSYFVMGTCSLNCFLISGSIRKEKSERIKSFVFGSDVNSAGSPLL